ncbi:hypothetical protein PspMM1_34640 [Pseudoalteromonas sp. MM1]|uniref:hypothetical protein n=1 Tax=Pseudoalteromonas sp. MM1 TaxID=3036714 RepID=UPI0025740445|nr:hypothetical protein [Pseudoalteromonas sp. MM1]BED90996.1 hypothetical protein PspMM1_34640 [Pseudoalteromonas sp. MM1]
MNSIILIFFSIALVLAPSQVLAEQQLPTQFDNNRIILIPELISGKKLRFFTDTGGGWNAISKELHQQYNWPTIIKVADGEEYTLSEMPKFKAEAEIPAGGIENFMAGYLFIAPEAELSKEQQFDGFLGGRWHAEKIIKIDYVNESMFILDSLDEVNLNKFKKVELGFQKDSQQKYTTAFPRMSIKVQGIEYQMLLDTGATSTLTNTAKKQIQSKSNVVGTSFIAASVFDNWKARNPDWDVIEKAEHGTEEAIIKVPFVIIAEQSIGPVWFTRREDNNFHEFMSSMMDKKIDGAFGGSGLKYFDLVIDYIDEHAYFKAKL